MIRFIFLTAFFAVCILHLFCCWTDQTRMRALSKPFLLLFLFFYYLTSAHPVLVIICAALLTSWLGDILLIFGTEKLLVAGGTSFLVSHLLFIAAYLPGIDPAQIKPVVLVPVGIGYLCCAFLVIRSLRDNAPKPMQAGLFLYLAVNTAMNLCALAYLMSVHSGDVLVYLGAVSFFASDCILFLVLYHKNRDLIYKKHFFVMLTYLCGEFFITQGLLFG